MTENKIIEESPKEMKETIVKEKKEKKQVASKAKKEKKETTSKEKKETTSKEKKETISKKSEETSSKENNYDVNMTFLDDNQVKVEVKKQFGDEDEDGDEVLKEILKPKISNSYQEEIDKLDDMIKMIKTFPISDDPEKKDQVIDQLKNTLAILMTQSQNLIKEMQQMSRRNSYFKNNIILAAFILDKCRKDVPETEEEFDNMFN
jgi:hypothetical protein